MRVLAFIAGSSLLLQLHVATHRRQSAWLSSLIKTRTTQTEPTANPIAQAQSALGTGSGGLRQALDAAFALLRAASERPLVGARLEAQLGLAHARFGVLELADVDARTLPRDTQKAYVHAWVRNMLHLDPDAQLVRWQVQRGGSSVLVSCISEEAYGTLSIFCSEHGLAFTSCTPAALAVTRAEYQRKAVSVIWTECLGSQREPTVQMLHLDDGAVRATWRGWMPSSPFGSAEEELHAAALRFQAFHGIGDGEHLSRLQWPACAQSAGAQ